MPSRAPRWFYPPAGRHLRVLDIAAIEGVTRQAVYRRCDPSTGAVRPARAVGKRRGIPVYAYDGVTIYAVSVADAVRRSGISESTLRCSYLALYRDGWRLAREIPPRRQKEINHG